VLGLVVTVSSSDPPLLPGAHVPGETATVPPSCVTVTACPPIVTVADRGVTCDVPVACTATVRVPVPVVGVTVSHAASLLAVHVVVGRAVDTTIVSPGAPVAAAPTSNDAGHTVMVSAAAWVTTTDRPPIVAVAVRGTAPVYAAAFSTTLPLPVPLAALSVSHG
jgi:hypothetical protein